MTVTFGNGPFGIVHQSVLSMDISSTAFKVYVAMSTYADRAGASFPSQAKLAEQCGFQRQTVCTAISELEKAGLLSRVKANKSSTVVTYVLTPPCQHKPTTSLSAYADTEHTIVYNNVPSGSKFTPPTVQDCVLYGQSISLPQGEAEKFHRHFKDRQWKRGPMQNIPMKDWRGCMRTWEINYRTGFQPGGVSNDGGGTKARQARPWAAKNGKSQTGADPHETTMDEVYSLREEKSLREATASAERG